MKYKLRLLNGEIVESNHDRRWWNRRVKAGRKFIGEKNFAKIKWDRIVMTSHGLCPFGQSFPSVDISSDELKEDNYNLKEFIGLHPRASDSDIKNWFVDHGFYRPQGIEHGFKENEPNGWEILHDTWLRERNKSLIKPFPSGELNILAGKNER